MTDGDADYADDADDADKNQKEDIVHVSRSPRRPRPVLSCAYGGDMEEKLKHADITDKILKAFFTKVYRRLGYGFLEKVYVNALVIELRRWGWRLRAGQDHRLL